MYESRKIQGTIYLKKSGLDKSGKAPIMGHITVNQSKVQFSSKISYTPSLWNPRESRLESKSNETVNVNTKIEKLLLAVHYAFDSLIERNKLFDTESIKNLYQGSMNTQMTLLTFLNQHVDSLRARIGIDVAPISTYVYTQRSLGNFIKKKFRTKGVAFGQLNE